MSDKPIARCSGPLARRNFLQAGALGLGGLSLGDLFRLRSEAKTIGQPSPDTSVIFVWLPGGMSQLETYDMKPEAPSDYRGEFNPIQTCVPGLDLCEYLPLHAKIADRFNLIRSMSHKFADHGGGHKRFMTGRIPKTPVNTVNDAPAVGSIVAKMREDRNVGMPNYISAGHGNADTFAFGAAYLGSAYTPFNVLKDPSDPNFNVPNTSLSPAMENRLGTRIQLLKDFDKIRREIDQSGAMDAMDDFNRGAIGLLTSNKARDAFDLSKEDPKLRDRYGRHQWGQRALMARRLVEAGSSFVTIVMENAYVSGISRPRDAVYNWDSHAVNCHLFNDTRRRLPIYDQSVTALIEDLYNRGLDKKVMLVVATEFGRSPRIRHSIGSQTHVMQPGRDHWPGAISALICGGGMRTGQVIGSTNSKAEHPQDRPLSPNDLWATVYRHLGIDTELTFKNHAGRPMPILPFGKPIPELL